MKDCIALADVHIGVPPAALQVSRSVMIHFHDFSGLNSTKGKKVVSSTFSCFNNDWRVDLFPGGCGTDNAEDGKISLYLRLCSEEETSVEVQIILWGQDGEITKQTKSWRFTQTYKGASSWGLPAFAERSLLLDHLKNGTLSLELRMKFEPSQSPANFVPDNAFAQSMSKLFFDKEDADVLLEITSASGDISEEYRAHRLVLKMCAPDLARLCEGCDKSTAVPIPNVEPRVFYQLLRHVYGLKVSADWKKDAKKFIDAADQYSVANLKVEAEAKYVSYCNFNADNAIEEFLYADGKNCPLLREAAMKFIAENAKEVIRSDSFAELLKAEDKIKEVILAMVTSGQTSEDEKAASINDLRMALHNKGLDVDGSREMLTARLKK